MGKNSKPVIPEGEISLANLSIGETACVVGLTAEERLRRRLLDLGFVPGTVVKCLRRSPLGDPTSFLIRGAVIALRKEEARLINVRLKPERQEG